MSKPTSQKLPVLRFIDWKTPFLPSFVTDLMTRFGKDLSGKIIVVPTAESGRRLRHTLAQQGCKLAPKVVTPQHFLAARDSGQDLASLSAWVSVLLEIQLDDTRGLFPKDPPEGVVKSFRWAFNVGKQLHELASSISETEKNFAEIARMSAGGLDGERWADLARLAAKVQQTKRKWKIEDSPHYHTIPNHAEIIIAAVADLSPLVSAKLTELLAQGASINVVVHGDTKLPHGFDDWGRPVPSVWLEEPIHFPNWSQNMLICEKPNLLGEQVVAQIARMQWLPEDITLGLCDKELAAPISRELERAGWDVYDPEGKPLKSSSLLQFLKSLRAWLAEERPVSALLDMLRLPQMDTFLHDSYPSRYTLIKEIEQVIAKRLVASSLDLLDYLEHSEQHFKSTTFLKNFLQNTALIYEGSPVKGLRGWVAKALNRSPQPVAASVVDDISQMFNVLELIEKQSKSVQLEQSLDLICEILSDKKTYTDPGGTMIDLKGWIELIYENAENLLLLGLHEGAVPSASIGGDDPFLPDSMREMLGIETSRDHYARDSYLLRCLLESRKNVFIYLTKLNESNVPNTPSRLLLRSTGQDLALRVQRCFGESDVTPKNPSAWQRDWTLTLPEKPNRYDPRLTTEDAPPQKLSPTALRDYLHCPLRFYLQRVLKMERFEPDKSEMDALDFGNLVHAVVEKFGLDKTIRHSSNQQEISECFDELLEQEAFARFGNKLNLALQMQVQIARNRLRALAPQQADQRAQGWKITDVELQVGKDLEWTIAGHPITMVLDRVEHHEHTGEIRIMDYKTSSKAKSPKDAHLETFKPDENKPILSDMLMNRKKELRWCNLQLPLYAWFAQEHYGSKEIPKVGYIQLPNALSDTAFEEWEAFDANLLNSAKKWATEAVKRIENSDFFSPANLSTKEQSWDSYAKLAQGDIKTAFGL